MTLLDLKRTTDTNVNLVLECPLVVMVVHMAILMDSVRCAVDVTKMAIAKVPCRHSRARFLQPLQDVKLYEANASASTELDAFPAEFERETILAPPGVL
nr:unnamed protein product [Haemonchus contortus]